MCEDVGAKYFGLQCMPDKLVYRENMPFGFVSYIRGPFQGFIENAGGLRYDERLPLKEDYDMTLQQLNRFRRVLRINKCFYVCEQSTIPGGCASYRNLER